ncbi:MAG TPA: hypothetical protein VGH00_05205 [Chthoniobacterales bacterium]
MNYSRLLPAAAVLATCFAGCSSASKGPVLISTAKRDGKVFVVSADSAPFFRHGPQAGREPDKTLLKDTVVKLIRPSFGYSKVEVAATGEQGYVASDEIKPASSALLAAASAPKPDPLAAPSPQATPEQFDLNSTDPRLVPPPEDLPPVDLPTPAPER